MSWAESLIEEYSEGRVLLKQMTGRLGNSEADNIDRTLLNSMHADMSFIIEWLENGKQPGAHRGIDMRSAYQIQYLEDMDLIPDITNQISQERTDLHLEDYHREVLAKLFRRLSRRERQCFILHVGQQKTMNEIAKILGISKSSVQEYLVRTREKVQFVVQE